MATLDMASTPWRAVDENGRPVKQALMYVYVNNTTTPVTTYSDSAMTTANAHPIVANGGGFFGLVYVADGASYTVDITDPNGASLEGYPRNDVSLTAGTDAELAAAIAATQVAQAAAETAEDNAATSAATATTAANTATSAAGILAVDGYYATEAAMNAAGLSNGDQGIIPENGGLRVWEISGDVAAETSIFVKEAVYSSFAAFIASNEPARGVGQVTTVSGPDGVSHYAQASGTGNLGQTSAAGVEFNISAVDFNVRDFGASGDGTTDDTAAIQAALDAAFATGDYTTVVVPRSPSAQPYVFTELLVKAKTRFTSSGGVLKLKSGVCTDAAVDYYPINNLNHADVWYDKLRVDGNGANNTLFNVADAITCVGENSKVTGCRIWDAPDSGIMFSGSENGLCADNRVNGAPDVCIYVNAEEGSDGLYGAIVRGNICTDGVYGGISIKRSSAHLIVANNTIRRCGNAMTFEEFGVGSGGTPGPLIIEGNLAVDIGYMHRTASPPPGETGINLQLAENVILRGNHFHNVSGIIIGLSGAKGCVVEGNMCVGYRTDPNTGTYGNVGLLMATRSAIIPQYNTVSSNVFRGMADEGMYLQDGENNLVWANVAYDTQGSFQSIRLEGTFDNNVVSGNIAHGNTNDITVASGATGNILTSNRQPNGTGVEKSGMRRSVSHATPVGNIAPRGAGELIHITTGSKVFIATGETSADWIELT